MLKSNLLLVFCLILVTCCDTPPPSVQRGAVVNLFSNTLTAEDQSLFDNFEQATRLKVNIYSLSDSKIIGYLTNSPNDSSSVDVLLLEGIGLLQQVESAGMWDTLPTSSYQEVIPSSLYGANQQWIAVGYSAGVLGYLNERLDTLQFKSYDILADAEWQNKLAISARPNFVLSLLAGMLADREENAVQSWWSAVQANQTPADSTPWLLLYATDAMVHRDSLADRTDLNFLFPKAETYLHITGAGVIKDAPHPERARALLAYLFSQKFMQSYTERYGLYPSRADIAAPATLDQLGSFQADSTPQGQISKYIGTAQRLLDWDIPNQ